MSDIEAIQSVLASASRRRRWQRAWNGLWQGLAVGALIWLVGLSVYKLFPVPLIVPNIALGVAGICVLAGFGRGWFHKTTLRQTARCLDDRQNLEERLTTALEFAPDATGNDWRSLLVSDAAKFAAKLDPRKVFPFKLPRVSRWALAALALGAGLGFVPEYRSKAYVAKQTEAQVLKDIGKHIVEITHQSLEQRPHVMEPARKAVEGGEEIGMKLEKGVLTRNDALKDLASVADKLKEQLQDLGKKNPELKALEKAAHEQKAESASSSSAASQKQMDALQKALGNAADNPEALDKLGEKMQQLQKAAAGLPQDNSPAAAAERQKLAQSMSELADQAHQLGQTLPNLDDAINALQNSKMENFQKDMDLATQDLEKTQQMSKELQKMQEQADRDGKDLPEQLKFGQADLAQASVNKMIEKLKTGKLSADEAAKLLDEVARSVQPASPYGETAKHLHDAAQKMRGGDKPAAAESLAAAAKELEKMQAEMADAKAIQGSLDALAKAESALATHTAFGQCPHCGDASGKCMAAGHCLNAGKGVGRGGVGTWTDDNSQLYPEMSSTWDNSGISQRNMDGKGLTDRGDPQLAENLSPTKLHGQITPGSPMPSITLKGVSIKGKSSVSYTEAAAAAQSDARAALNQDQVPRAYQGAVKDYFNDIKP